LALGFTLGGPVRYVPTTVGGFSFIGWAKGSIFFPAQSSDVLEKEALD